MTIGPHALEQRGHRRENVRRGPLGTSAVERRLGRIFDAELHRLRIGRAGQVGHHRKRHVDAGGDATARDDRAVAHHAAFVDDRTERRQQVAPRPVAGGPPALQHSGRAEHQRPAAHGGNIAGAEREPAHLADECSVGDRVDHAEPARHADEIGVRDVGEPLDLGNGQAAVRADRSAAHRGSPDSRARQTPEHFVRPGEIELRDMIEQCEYDDERRGGHHDLPRYERRVASRRALSVAMSFLPHFLP